MNTIDTSEPPGTLASAGAEAPGGHDAGPWHDDRITGAVSGMLVMAGERGQDRPALRYAVTDWLGTRFDTSARTRLARYGYELWRVRCQDLPALVEAYVPPALRAGWRRPIKRREKWIDPVPLVREARANDDSVAAFEAKRDLSLAYHFQWLIEDAERYGIANLKEWNAIEDDTRGPRRLLHFLKKQKVVRGTEWPIELRTFHDPANANRCVGIRFTDGRVFLDGDGTPGPEGVMPLSDLVTLNVPGNPIQAILTVRRKGLLQTVAKMLIIGADNPFAVQDRRGMRFSFRNREDLEIGSAFVAERLGTGPAPKRHLAATDPPINPHAAADLLMAKGSVKYGAYWSLEIQYLLARQHVDLAVSLGAENTALYHRRQYTDPKGLFAQIFPERLYGVDWQDPTVQDAMDEYVRARIPR